MKPFLYNKLYFLTIANSRELVVIVDEPRIVTLFREKKLGFWSFYQN